MTAVAAGPIDLGAGPLSTRLFVGYRAPSLAENAADDAATRATKRQTFFNELGSTFMPGTPLMQAPIGLSAYLPAVINPPDGSGLPDEVAAIVYASRPVYDHFRTNSLSRRIYTHAHVAVFDMPRAVAQFPAALPSPTTVLANGANHHFTFLFADASTDWQFGTTRIFFLVADAPAPAFATNMLGRLGEAASAAHAAGIDQVLIAAADGFAALWVHSAKPVDDPLGALSLMPTDASVLRDLVAQPASVIGESERGVSITGPAAFTFRFERRLELFR